MFSYFFRKVNAPNLQNRLLSEQKDSKPEMNLNSSDLEMINFTASPSRTLVIQGPKYLAEVKPGDKSLANFASTDPVIETLNDFLDVPNRVHLMKTSSSLHKTLKNFPLTIYQVTGLFQKNKKYLLRDGLDMNKRSLEYYGEKALKSFHSLNLIRPELDIDFILDLEIRHLCELFKKITFVDTRKFKDRLSIGLKQCEEPGTCKSLCEASIQKRPT